MIEISQNKKIDPQKLREAVLAGGIIEVDNWDDFRAVSMATSDPIKARKEFHWTNPLSAPKAYIKVSRSMDFWSYDTRREYFLAKDFNIVPFKAICFSSLEGLEL